MLGASEDVQVYSIYLKSPTKDTILPVLSQIAEPSLEAEARAVPSVLADALAALSGRVSVKSIVVSTGVVIATPTHMLWLDAHLSSVISDTTVTQCTETDALVGLVASANGDHVWMACTTAENVSTVVRTSCRGCTPTTVAGFVGPVTSLTMDSDTGDVAVGTTLGTGCERTTGYNHILASYRPRFH